MTQSAAERPIPSVFRKATIATGRAADHAGKVSIQPIPAFDLDRTIFNTLEGKAARFIITTRIAKEPRWDQQVAQKVEESYQESRKRYPLPKVSEELLRFMVEECDFDVEHADGSFLDHLYFCFEYGVQHYPEHSALVLLLHSILGTGTNTFAMSADKIPELRALLTEFEWKQIEAFPSILRLLYDLPFRRELRANLSRIDSLEAIRFRRVIDNEPLELSAEDLFIQLNYQLIHLTDFLPVANWVAHANDPAFIIFRDLHDLLDRCGKRGARLDYDPARGPRKLERETMGFAGKLTTLIPASLNEKVAAASVRRFSKRIGHATEYELVWR